MRYVSLVLCMLFLIGVAILSFVNIQPIIKADSGNSETIETLDQCVEFLTVLSEQFEFEDMVLKNTPEQGVLSLSDSAVSGVTKDISLQKTYSSWTAELDIFSSFLYNNDPVDLSGEITMAVTETEKYFCIEDAVVSYCSEMVYFHIKYDAEIYLSDDLALIKFNRYEGLESIGIEISKGMLGKWFEIDSFDNFYGQALIEMMALGVDDFLEKVQFMADAARYNKDSVIASTKKYILFLESGTLEADMTVPKRPFFDISTDYEEYDYTANCTYAIAITNINNTLIDFPDVEIEQDLEYYIKETD